jgi:hypothetical protein
MAVFTLTSAALAKNQHKVDGLINEAVTATITTAMIDSGDEQVHAYLFPPNAYLYDVSVKPTDVDTHTTPTLVFDLGLADADGVLDTTLISGSTAGQAGVRDDLDATVKRFTACGGKYLTIDVTTTAATPAAGTIEIAIVYTVNLHQMTGA